MHGDQAAVTALDGAIVVDKPEGWTSHDVVAKMRRLAQTKKAGHLGTLDPIATGVLPLLLGRATRLAQFFTRNDKMYDGTVRFGYATDTYDRQGEPSGPMLEAFPDAARIEERLERFRGKFMQTPPPVSAKKVGGVAAYKLARQKREFTLAPVEVQVYELKLLSVEGTEARIRCHCSAGTYLRSIAHELGVELGCGAHLKELRRTASGDFSIDQARTLDELAELAAAGRLAEVLVPAAQLLPQFPSQFVDELAEGRIRQGRDFAVSPFRSGRESRYVKAVSRAGQLVAVGEMKLPNVCHPIIVL
jgi:tRNA pseudouridine55 synthase